MFRYETVNGAGAMIEGHKIPSAEKGGLQIKERCVLLDEWVEQGLLTCTEVAPEGYELTYLEDMTVKELKAYAAENDISLKGLKKRLDIVHAIEAALDED